MPNRSIAPTLNIPQQLAFPKPIELSFANGLKLSAINSGTSDVVRLSLIFNAGTRYQTQTFVASAALNMLCEGTKKYNAAELAERLDFYGSSLDVSIDRDFATVTVYMLGKYMNETLDMLEQLVRYPTFPENELATYVQKNKERLVFERQRVEKQAGELLASALYGKSHPYGSFGEPEEYDSLTASLLTNFHHTYYTPTNAFAVVAGKLSDERLKQIEKFLGSDVWGSTQLPKDTADFTLHPSPEKQLLKEKKDSVQSALRLGKIMFERTHTDYNGLTILNTVLGGYFGSRLMKNIREDKGYTYGIYSMLVTMKEAGHLVIVTETGCEYTNACINEIRKELELLRSEPISEEELTLVKRYTIGDMLRSLDGPWALSDVLIDIKQSGLAYTQVEEFFNELNNVTTERLQQLAQTYLDPAGFTEVVAGRKG